MFFKRGVTVTETFMITRSGKHSSMLIQTIKIVYRRS